MRGVSEQRLSPDGATRRLDPLVSVRRRRLTPKAAANRAVHGVTFEMARLVFRDPFAIDWLDEREHYGEDRYAIIGVAEGRLLFVAYTMRGERTRIISARGAEPDERRQYHEDNP